MREEVFGTVLRMSLIGCYSVGIVFLVRAFLLKLLKAPRKYAYYLWMIVFLNLCIPISMESPVSLIPEGVEELSVRTGQTLSPDVFVLSDAVPGEAGEESAGNSEEGRAESFGNRERSKEVDFGSGESSEEDAKAPDAGPGSGLTQALQSVLALLSLAWIPGMLLLLGFQGFSALRLRRKIAGCRCVRKSRKRRIWELQGLPEPFLWGFFRPVICLPSGLESTERQYILAHEECHRKRKDPLVKGMVLLVTAIHWFNPFAWAACVLCFRDMEISCDEAVVSGMTGKVRKAYASSLLKYAARQNGYLFSPLAFGEPSLKSRIKNILSYRKRPFAVQTAALAVILAAAAGLALRPGEKPAGNQTGEAEIQTGTGEEGTAETQTQIQAGGAAEEKAEGQSLAEDQKVINNGGQFIQVDGQLYYMDSDRLYSSDERWTTPFYINGQALYSDGRQLYLTNYDNDGTPHIYQYSLEGNSFTQLMRGELAGCSPDGGMLYYLSVPSEDTGKRSLMSFDLSAWQGGELCAEVEAVLGQEGDSLYVLRQQADGLAVDEILRTENGVQIQENILGQTLSGTQAVTFYADEEWLLLSAGSYEGSIGNLDGQFYAFSRETKALTSRPAAGDGRFCVLDGAVFYQENSYEGGQTLLCRTEMDLSEREVVSEELELVGALKEAGRLLVRTRSGQDLASILPDGSSMEVLAEAQEISDWQTQMEEGDRVQYSQVNDLGGSFFVRAQLLGWREELSTGWRDAVLDDVWLRAETDGNSFEVWTPPVQDEGVGAVTTGEPVEPLEAGWDLTEVQDIRETFERMSYVPEPGTEERTYLIGETEQYRVYGKGDFESMLIERDGSYAELVYPYASNYMVPPEVLEQDFDGDGSAELALKLGGIKHGTGLYIDTLFVADSAENRELYAYEFSEDSFKAQFSSHLSYERVEEGILPEIDGRTAWGVIADRDGMTFEKADVGSQMRFSFENQQIVLTAELELWTDEPGRVTPEFAGEYAQARVIYEDGGGFALADFSKGENFRLP